MNNTADSCFILYALAMYIHTAWGKRNMGGSKIFLKSKCMLTVKPKGRASQYIV